MKFVKSYKYEIIKESDVLHADIVAAIAQNFSVEVVDDIDEKSTYNAPKIIVRRKNGLEVAAQRTNMTPTQED